jgi:acetoin utilization protein AcuC
MLPGTDDHVFWKGFTTVVPHLMEAFRTDVVVSQLGVDAFLTDPLAALEFTTNGFIQAVAYLTKEAPAWVALGGGGYNPANVARAWTLAWATMNDVELPNELPEEMRAPLAAQGHRGESLRDPEHVSAVQEPCLEHMKRCVGYLEEHVFPRIM